MDLIMDGWEPTEVSDYAEASDIYARRRDDSGLGASEFGDGHIATPSGARIARISYNGRVWRPGKWKPDDAPLWDNRDPGARPAAFPDMSKRPPTLEEQDRLDEIHHRAVRIRQAIRALGIHLTHDDAAHVLAKAAGCRNATQYRREVMRGDAKGWSHHAAAAAVADRLGANHADARIAADAAVHSIMRDAATVSEVADMVRAAPAVALLPIPTEHVEEQDARLLRDSGLLTIGDLVARAEGLGSRELDAALDALTRARRTMEKPQC